MFLTAPQRAKVGTDLIQLRPGPMKTKKFNTSVDHVADALARVTVAGGAAFGGDYVAAFLTPTVVDTSQVDEDHEGGPSTGWSDAMPDACLAIEMANDSPFGLLVMLPAATWV